MTQFTPAAISKLSKRAVNRRHQSELRERVAAAGGRQIGTFISRRTNEKLTFLQHEEDVTIREIVEFLINDAGAQDAIRRGKAARGPDRN